MLDRVSIKKWKAIVHDPRGSLLLWMSAAGLLFGWIAGLLLMMISVSLEGKLIASLAFMVSLSFSFGLLFFVLKRLWPKVKWFINQMTEGGS